MSQKNEPYYISETEHSREEGIYENDRFSVQELNHVKSAPPSNSNAPFPAHYKRATLTTGMKVLWAITAIGSFALGAAIVYGIRILHGDASSRSEALAVTASEFCPGSDWLLDEKTGACYKYFDEKKNAKDAEAHCQSFGADVPDEFWSEEEMLLIQKLLPEHILTSVGIDDELLSTPDSSQCPVFSGLGYYLNDDRDDCAEKTETFVDLPWRFFPEVKKCYYHNLEKLPWTRARDFCTEIGANLASIHSAEEQAAVEEVSLRGAYIGLNDRGTDGDFVWSDGTPLDYVNWAPGQPDPKKEDCVQTYTNGQWNDLQCQQERTSVCKVDMRTPKTKNL